MSKLFDYCAVHEGRDRRLTPSFMFAAAAIVIGIAAAHAAAAQPVEKYVAAHAQGEVEIVNVAGEVRVSGWDKAQVHVSAELGAGVERLDVRSEGKRTIVEVVLPRRGSNSGESNLTVRVPRDSSLIIKTVSASQEIEGVRGAQRLQAVSGSILAETFGREFEAKTVSGDVEARGRGTAAPARAAVTTVSGDVRLINIGPELELETVTGDMNATAQELARARIKTTNGELKLTARLRRGARVDAEAVNGDLRFSLREPVSAQFDIETFNGEIDNCFGPEPRRSREFAPGVELRFSEGKGEAQVRIKTLNGDVALCKAVD